MSDLIGTESPEKVSVALRRAADAFRESANELIAHWQDPRAGRIWIRLASVLDGAALAADRAISTEFGAIKNRRKKQSRGR